MILINDVTQIDASDILAFENEVGIGFLEDYKAFMLKSNGETPKEDWLYDFFLIRSQREITHL